MAASMPNPEMIKKNKEDIAALNANITSKIGTLQQVVHENNRLKFTFTDGFKFNIEVNKLNATQNYLQAWVGQGPADKGYIIFDVSRGVDD